MANINSLYPSNYLKAADLQGKAIRVGIARIVAERIGNDDKNVMYFQGKQKGMVLNKTNAFTIAQAFGPETDNWTGAEIELFPAWVDFQGKQTEAIRIRVPAAPPRSANIAPNARDRAEPDIGSAHRASLAGELNDEIPFSPEFR
jgi:hypothetical protein